MLLILLKKVPGEDQEEVGPRQQGARSSTPEARITANSSSRVTGRIESAGCISWPLVSQQDHFGRFGS